MPRPEGYWHLSGLLYDLAFLPMFRGLRGRVARAVEDGRLYPWLDLCCGTGDQLRKRLCRGVRGDAPLARVPVLDTPPGPIIAGNAGLGRALAIGLDLNFGLVRYAAARAPGVPFVCADAARLPFKPGAMRAVSVSFGLHDKSPELRAGILAEAKRVMAPDGRLVAVDFENPWNAGSRAGALFVRAVERLARADHYRNGRDFLRRGGLRALLRENGFVETARHDVEAGSLGVVVARPLE